MKQGIKDYFLPLVFFVGAVIALIINVNYESRLNKIYDTVLYPKTPQPTTVSSKTKTSDGNKTEIQGHYKTLLGNDKKLRCTFRSDTSNTAISGSLLTDGTVLKTFVTSRINDIYSENNGLVLLKETYIWPSGSENGVKLLNEKVPEYKELTPVSELFLRAGIGPVYDYTCYNWENYDKNNFVVPINVTFHDMTGTIDKLQADPCSVCTSIQDAAKQTNCKKVYNCK